MDAIHSMRTAPPNGPAHRKVRFADIGSLLTVISCDCRMSCGSATLSLTERQGQMQQACAAGTLSDLASCATFNT